MRFIELSSQVKKSLILIQELCSKFSKEDLSFSITGTTISYAYKKNGIIIHSIDEKELQSETEESDESIDRSSERTDSENVGRRKRTNFENYSAKKRRIIAENDVENNDLGENFRSENIDESENFQNVHEVIVNDLFNTFIDLDVCDDENNDLGENFRSENIDESENFQNVHEVIVNEKKNEENMDGENDHIVRSREDSIEEGNEAGSSVEVASVNEKKNEENMDGENDHIVRSREESIEEGNEAGSSVEVASGDENNDLGENFRSENIDESENFQNVHEVIVNEKKNEENMDGENDHIVRSREESIEEGNEAGSSVEVASGEKSENNDIGLAEADLTTYVEDILTPPKFFKLKNDLLSKDYPDFLFHNRKFIVENSFENLLQNCLTASKRVHISNVMSLFYYFQIGMYLDHILNILMKDDEISIINDKVITNGLIKGSGISNLYQKPDGSYNLTSAFSFYERATRIFKIYSCFPFPIDQILRTGNKISASRFNKLGNKCLFDRLMIEISNSVMNDNYFLETMILSDSDYQLLIQNYKKMNDIDDIIVRIKNNITVEICM